MARPSSRVRWRACSAEMSVPARDPPAPQRLLMSGSVRPSLPSAQQRSQVQLSTGGSSFRRTVSRFHAKDPANVGEMKAESWTAKSKTIRDAMGNRLKKGNRVQRANAAAAAAAAA